MKRTRRNAAAAKAAEPDVDSRQAEPATVAVLTRVRELIVTGEIPPGSRLAAEAIARELGVSRTPVRSAFAVLSAEGLVSYEVNRGYTVREITIRDVLDAIEVRAVLEGRGCGLSVDYGWNPESMAALREVVAAGREIVDAGVWSEDMERNWYALNRNFHQQVIHASRNAALRNAVSGDKVPEDTPPPREIGVLFVATAYSQELADTIAQACNPYFFHFPNVPNKELPSYGFPFSPAQVPRGQIYEFKLNHVVEVEDPLELIRPVWIDLAKGGSASG